MELAVNVVSTVTWVTWVVRCQLSKVNAREFPAPRSTRLSRPRVGRLVEGEGHVLLAARRADVVLQVRAAELSREKRMTWPFASTCSTRLPLASKAKVHGHDEGVPQLLLSGSSSFRRSPRVS